MVKPNSATEPKVTWLHCPTQDCPFIAGPCTGLWPFRQQALAPFLQQAMPVEEVCAANGIADANRNKIDSRQLTIRCRVGILCLTLSESITRQNGKFSMRNLLVLCALARFPTGQEPGRKSIEAWKLKAVAKGTDDESHQAAPHPNSPSAHSVVVGRPRMPNWTKLSFDKHFS